jgi:Na+-driven multidrug efflux pump
MANTLKRIDWGHVAFVLFIAGTVAWYFADAYRASGSIKNMILIAPASGLALLLCAIILVQDFRQALAAPPESAPRPKAEGKPAAATKEGRHDARRAIAFIVVFGLYVGLLEVIGYDVATVLFIAAAMVMNGERRVLPIVGFSVVFGGLAVWLFGLLLPYPMPTLVVPN